MSTTILSTETVGLSSGDEAAVQVRLCGVAPGERGSRAVTVRYCGDRDAVVAMRVRREDAPAPCAERIRVGIYESSRRQLPYPVFTGSLADCTSPERPERGFGNWTAQGDGDPHEVTYQICWHLSEDAPADDEADLTLTFAARGIG
ncbi:hypothetical protein [Actinomadura rupiterrae]|uniref:hypothetical protein n=1 Tax=Actinomadura rupiterrae TaxID=559627 RepID=UPI0020A322EB|nr:hypothetical protein [Actinomadura rupiterrae]MCP2335110.1 hypothetical protein [Actinomadura rupiterrae]